MNISTILSNIISCGRIIDEHRPSRLFHFFTQRERKKFIRLFPILFLGLIVTTALHAQRPVITHNINTQGTLTISSALFGNDYIIKGEGIGNETANRVIIETGYMGTITLDNVHIRGANNYAAIRVKGLNNGDVLDPKTKVTIILKGNNQLESGGTSTYDPKTTKPTSQYFSNAAALQVDLGAQIHIKAIDETDNASGGLIARSYHNSDGGAGIGGPNSYAGTIGDAGIQGTVTSWGPSNQTGSKSVSGGNILISSGTIFARGGRCGAGIGGGYMTLFSGNIIIFGGDVTAYGGDHSAGIGTGCPNMSGNNGWYSYTSSIIALPPAKITATSEQSGKPGLAGANSITYVGDPQSPLVTVKTVENTMDADIYADISETTSVSNIFTALGITEDMCDLKKIKFGNTGTAGQINFRATFAQNVTFFTDARSTISATLDRPFRPQTTTVTAAKTITLPLLNTSMAFEATAAIPLELGYSSVQALTNSYKLKLTYTDSKPMTGVDFDLQAGASSNFSDIKYYGPDGVTEISEPNTLSSGQVYYISVPIQQGKAIGIYNDVLRISGIWDGAATGYIRQVITQRVVYNDTNTNTYIKVSASQNKFTVVHPTTNEVTLNLNINHSGLTVPYDANDVTAKYLITTEPDYDAALAATPLTGWTNMTRPSAESTNTASTVSFSGKAVGTYYIHWYVVSGVVYGHSKTVTDPPLTNGGYGPYKILNAVQAGSLTAQPYVCFGKIPAQITGTTPTGGSGDFAYQWQISTNNSTWTNISGTNTINYTPTAALTVSPTYFRREVKDNQLGTTTATASVKIEERAELKAGTVGTTQAICYNTAPLQLTGTVSTGGDGNYTYQWQSSADGISGWTNVDANGTSVSYLPPISTTTTHYRRETKDNASCGPVYSNVVKITVYAKLEAGTISGNQTICYSALPTQLTGTSGIGGDGNYKYQWQSSANGTSGWTNIATNGTSASYSPPALTATTYYRRETKDNASCGTVYTDIIKVEVHPQVVAGTIKGNSFVCQNMVPLPIQGDVSTGGSSTANLKYQWQSSTDGTIWTNISGAMAKDYTPGVLSSDTYFRRVTTDDFCNTFKHNSNAFLIKVVAQPTALYWKQTAADSNWNNPDNWIDKDGNQLGMVPLACTDVQITGGSNNYPSLDLMSTPVDLYGTPQCKNITFQYGSEVAYQYKLAYEKAFVQYNWGYYSSTSGLAEGTQPDMNGSGSSCLVKERDTWYALAAPLKNMASGDFSFGGFPVTWQGGFNIQDPVTGQSVEVEAGDFSKAYARNDINLAETNNAVAIKVPSYKDQVGYNNHCHMDGLEGVLEFPYFENETKAPFYPAHTYDKFTGESKFFYFDTKTLQLIYSPVGRMKRGSEAYRFIYETSSNEVKNINIGGNSVPGYAQEISKHIATSQKVMVGNPFMASINSKRFLDANNIDPIAPKLLVSDGYFVFNSTLQIWENRPFSATNNIKPQQAFIVTLAEGVNSTELLYPFEGTYALTGPAFRGLSQVLPEGSSLYLKTSDNNDMSGDYAILNASRMGNNESNVKKMIYTEGHIVPETFFITPDGNDYNLVQAIEEGVKEIGIGVKCSDTQKPLKFTFENVSEFYSTYGVRPVLVDKFMSIEQDLTDNDTYHFNQRKTTVENKYIDADRFVLRMASPGDIVGSVNDGIHIVYQNGVLDVKSDRIIKTVHVYDLYGRLIHSNRQINTTVYTKSLSLAQGLYIVKVRTEDGKTKVEKIMAL